MLIVVKWLAHRSRCWRRWQFVIFADQEDRSRSVDQFRKGEKDVLVATDVASKGLDFSDVQHVINYDMPDDIENYGKNLEL